MFIASDLPFESQPEILGSPIDLKFLKEDQWLMDTEVRYLIRHWNSLWYLTMLYIAVEDPLKLICRRIDKYNSAKKAQTYAQILQRGIRKDARGVLKTNRNAFNFCDN